MGWGAANPHGRGWAKIGHHWDGGPAPLPRSPPPPHTALCPPAPAAGILSRSRRCTPIPPQRRCSHAQHPPSPAHTAPARTRTHGAPTLCAPTSNTHTRTHTPSSTHPAPTRPAQPRAPPSPAAHLQPPPPQDAGLVHSAAPPPPAAPAPPGAPGAPPSGPGTARHGTGVAGSGAGSTTVPSSPDGPAQ